MRKHGGFIAAKRVGHPPDLTFMVGLLSHNPDIEDEGLELEIGAGEALDKAAAEAAAEGAAKPDTQLTPAEKNTLEGAQDNETQLKTSQRVHREAGRPDRVGSTGKATQRVNNALKRIKKAADVPED
jgi:hypothetical protein